MVETQLGRRNLSPLQRVQIAEKYRPVFKKKAEEKQLSSLKQNSTVLPKSDQTDEKIHTRDELAKIAKVGHDTYGKAKKIIDLDTNNIKMIDTQLGRRNITLEQKSYLRGLQYEREKKKQGEHKGNQYSQMEKGENTHFPTTSERLAEQHKVNERTIREDARYAKAVDKIADTLIHKLTI